MSILSRLARGVQLHSLIHSARASLYSNAPFPFEWQTVAPTFRRSALVHDDFSQCRLNVWSYGERHVSTAAMPPGLPAEDLYVVPMPKLSHTMTKGRLVKWLKQEGDPIAMYDVLMEVETEELVEEVFKVEDFAGKVTLLVEAHEEGFLAKKLVPEGGSLVAVGAPVGLMVTSEEALALLRKAGANYACPTTDVYDDSQPQVQVLPWQSFLKSGKRQVKCMG
mmetsp:Transcript_23742/g.52089  ORF Transcript_23742/g.52089 Transcript_23742/m.52089 type:complete len:222 (+) Transcript_23742:63-728(+)